MDTRNSKPEMAPALLIVDLQQGFNPSNKLLTGIKAIIPSYNVIFQTQFLPGNPLFNQRLNWDPKTINSRLCLTIKGEILLPKTGYALCQEGILTITQKTKPLQEIHIVGLEIDACVLAAAFQLWDSQRTPIILYKLCGGDKNRQPAIKIANRQFGTTPTNLLSLSFPKPPTQTIIQ